MKHWKFYVAIFLVLFGLYGVADFALRVPLGADKMLLAFPLLLVVIGVCAWQDYRELK